MSAWKLWKQMFGVWEQSTTAYFDQLLRSPVVLEPAGAWLTSMMKLKATADEMAASGWGWLGLPTKRDQERTLHLINQLHSRILDLEERLEDVALAKDSSSKMITTTAGSPTQGQTHSQTHGQTHR